jgi:hypothetical protein
MLKLSSIHNIDEFIDWQEEGRPRRLSHLLPPCQQCCSVSYTSQWLSAYESKNVAPHSLEERVPIVKNLQILLIQIAIVRHCIFWLQTRLSQTPRAIFPRKNVI